MRIYPKICFENKCPNLIEYYVNRQPKVVISNNIIYMCKLGIFGGRFYVKYDKSGIIEFLDNYRRYDYGLRIEYNKECVYCKKHLIYARFLKLE